MLQLESERLFLREATESDLRTLLPVYLTNRQFLLWSNLSEYDLAASQRDLKEVWQTPGRCLLGIYRKNSDEAVGVADFLEHNPADGFPWLGLLIIHGAQQGQGLGRETYQRLAEHFQTDRGWAILRWVSSERTAQLSPFGAISASAQSRVTRAQSMLPPSV